VITAGAALAPPYRDANCAATLDHRLGTLRWALTLAGQPDSIWRESSDATCLIIGASLRRRELSRFGCESCERADDPASHCHGLAAKG
jgi:hypothetical protein